MLLVAIATLLIVSLKLIHAGKAAYYYVVKNGPTKDEYYVGRSDSNKKGIAGYWDGKGLSALDLKEGQPIYLNSPEFKALMNGRHPLTLEQLRQGKARVYTNPKTGREKVYEVVAGIDMVTSAPKWVSTF